MSLPVARIFFFVEAEAARVAQQNQTTGDVATRFEDRASPKLRCTASAAARIRFAWGKG
jgi:hypothetical protein